jgi:hypothetical protein
MVTRWLETGLGWRADMEAGVVLIVNRAHRGGGWSWELSAFHADDDARGIQPTDASAKHVAEKTYRAWRARQVV